MTRGGALGFCGVTLTCISDVYGADLPRVVAMMLNRDPRERPSAMALLGDPWVQVQVQQVASDLSSTIQARRSKDGLAGH